MSLLSWFCRCVPGLSILAVLALVEFALQILQTEYIGLSYPTFLVRHVTPVFAQTLFVAYSVFLHVLSLAFPLRLCRAVLRATNAIREAHSDNYEPLRSSLLRDGSDQDNEACEKVAVGIIMAILIPSYKEEIHILEDTLKVLASHELAQTSYDVRMASGERSHDASKLLTRHFHLRFS